MFYKITKNDPDWILYTDNAKYVGTRSTPGEPEEYLTLASIPAVNAEANAYWFKSFRSPNIPECAEVKFKVKINSESLAGNGAAIGVRVYKSTLAKNGAITEQYLVLSNERSSRFWQINRRSGGVVNSVLFAGDDSASHFRRIKRTDAGKSNVQ